MANLTVSLGSLIDRALIELQQFNEQGFAVTLNGNITSSVTTITLVSAGLPAINITDVIELHDAAAGTTEMVLVTANASSPTFTVSRGYFGTTGTAFTAATTTGIVNPQWPRNKIQDSVKRAMPRLEALGLPCTLVASGYRVPGYEQLLLPAGTRDVLQVKYMGVLRQIFDIDQWQFHRDLDIDVYGSDAILELPSYVQDTDIITYEYHLPYRWTGVGELATTPILEGAEDLPAQFAAAWNVSRREVSRSELDRANEAASNDAVKGGVSNQLVRQLWTEFYRNLDEARRLAPKPIHRPFMRMPKI